MTLVALTQEPEVKVRLAIAGKWCHPVCIGLVELGAPYATCRVYSTSDRFVKLRYKSMSERVPGQPTHERCRQCIAAHGGAE